MTDEQFVFRALHDHLPRWARARRAARDRRAAASGHRRAKATAMRVFATVAVRRKMPWGA